MRHAAFSAAVVAFMSIRAYAGSIAIDGTVCRMNRTIDRMIIKSDGGARFRVSLGHAVQINFHSHLYDRADLRSGDRVHVVATRQQSEMIASSFDVTMRVDDALVDSIFRSHRTVTGRFAVREAKTEFFSLHLPLQRYVRVDGKSAYGPNGRVYVSSLKPGDLLEVKGTWVSKDLLQASSIHILTDYEPSFCSTAARRNEMDMETAHREADEQRFLDHSSEK
jgi:hypothetical protein